MVGAKGSHRQQWVREGGEGGRPRVNEMQMMRVWLYSPGLTSPDGDVDVTLCTGGRAYCRPSPCLRTRSQRGGGCAVHQDRTAAPLQPAAYEGPMNGLALGGAGCGGFLCGKEMGCEGGRGSGQAARC